jgi:predicted nuclease of predicted toxin-antitoxin system
VRFFLDNDVDDAVAGALRRAGHECWTAAKAGLAAAADDEITAYAHDNHAVLITHDKEFSRRRQKNVVGKHVWLRCPELQAVDVLMDHLETILDLVHQYQDVCITVTVHGVVRLDFGWI